MATIIVIGDVVKTYDSQTLQIGEGKNSITGEAEPLMDTVSVSDIRVDKVIKGKVKPGDIIKIGQYGGRGMPTLREGKDDTVYYKEGDRRLFFVVDYPNSRYKSPCTPINPLQGDVLILNHKTFRRTHAQFIHGGIPENKLFKALKHKMDEISK